MLLPIVSNIQEIICYFCHIVSAIFSIHDEQGTPALSAGISSGTLDFLRNNEQVL